MSSEAPTISPETKRLLAQKITGSETFRKSDRLQKILAYLTECSIRNEVPKGVTIILDVFGKGALNSETGPANMHGNIYQLRKKLKEYYESEGQEDTFIIGLASGEYALTFIPNTSTTISVPPSPEDIVPVPQPEESSVPKISSSVAYWKWATLVLGLSAVVLLGLLFFDKNKSINTTDNPVLKNPFWQQLSHSSTKPIHLIVGAESTYAGKDSVFGEREIVFPAQLSSEAEQQQFLKAGTKDSLHLKGSVVRNPGTVRNLYDLTLLLAPFEKRLNLTYSNIFTWDNVYNGDIIYIGSIAELFKLRSLFNNTRVSVNPIHSEEFMLKSAAMKDSVLLKRTVTDTLIEAYFFAEKLPTQDNNTIWVLSGTSGTRDKSVRLFTQPDFLDALKGLLIKKFGHYPAYFEVVLKFKLYAKAGFDYEVIFMNELVRKDLYSEK